MKKVLFLGVLLVSAVLAGCVTFEATGVIGPAGPSGYYYGPDTYYYSSYPYYHYHRYGYGYSYGGHMPGPGHIGGSIPDMGRPPTWDPRYGYRYDR